MSSSMDVVGVLRQLGLEEKEARVYLELLRLGDATATELSRRTTIDRTLMYQLTEKLAAKGLLSLSIKKSIRHYVPTPPAHLQKQLDEKTHLLQHILPHLNDIAATHEQMASVELLQGKEGLRKILREILITGKDYDIFGESGEFNTVIPFDLERHYHELDRRNIAERVLLREGREIHGGTTQTVRFLPEEYLTKVTTVIFGNVVAIFIWSTPYYGIIIRNKDVADSYRTHFDLLWNIAKK